MVLFDLGVCTKFATRLETEIFEVRVLGFRVEGSSSWTFMLLVASGATVYRASQLWISGVLGFDVRFGAFGFWG